MDLKWALAIGLEAGFWVMLAAFLVVRYRYGIESATRWFVIGVVIDTVGLAALGVWDYTETGRVNSYTMFIVALLIYALGWGHQDLKRLDGWMARKVKPRRRGRTPTSA